MTSLSVVVHLLFVSYWVFLEVVVVVIVVVTAGVTVLVVVLIILGGSPGFFEVSGASPLCQKMSV